MTRFTSILGTAVKQLLGALFVFSALAKFVAIDQFNVYIFSYGFLSLRLSILAGWALVSTELLLGIVLISNRYHRLASWANIAMLVGFSLFLVYAQLIGRTESCHCLGEMLPFNPLQSLIKNGVLLLLSFFSLFCANVQWRPRWWSALLVALLPVGLFVAGAFSGWTSMTRIDFQYSVTLGACAVVACLLFSLPFARRLWVQILLALVPFVAVFVLNTYASLFSHPGTNPFDSERFSELLISDDQLSHQHLDSGHQVVALFSPTCPYCRMAAEKLAMIVSRHELPTSNITVVFPGDSITDNSQFFEATNSPRYRQLALDVDNYVRVTFGQLPVVVLLHDGKVESTYDHANLSESAIVRWLTIDNSSQSDNPQSSSNEE